MPSRELKNLPACLAQAERWGLTPAQLAKQVRRIGVKFEWAAPPSERAPVSFFRWILSDERHCPALHFALTEHSVRYRSDSSFETKNYEEWLEFCNIHCVFDSEFRPAWRRWASQHRKGPQLVN